MGHDPKAISQMLATYAGGKRNALEQIVPVVYDELRRIAARFIRRERKDHTLQPTALVHEAYVRLVDQTNLDWQDRAHFIGIAARQMREILVDHARSHGRQKRGGGRIKVELDDAPAPSAGAEIDLIMLDDALRALAAGDEETCRIVELRYFGGLSIEETAEALGISTATVKRDWALAKSWLRRRLSGADAP